MKKKSVIIVLLFVTVCIWHGVERLALQSRDQLWRDGQLSEIAQEVVAIPLRAAGMQLTEVRNLSREGNDLFLISREQLYRFDMQGRMVCPITQPGQIRVAHYMIDAAHRQLIVLGNADEVHYYDFDGNLLMATRLDDRREGYQVLAALLHRDRIYLIEKTSEATDGESRRSVKCQVTTYDTLFNALETRELAQEPLTQPHYTFPLYNLHLNILPDGEIYGYSHPSEPEYLLGDTLALAHKEKETAQGNVPLYPLQIGERYWLAYNRRLESQAYLYCWDSCRNRGWQLQKGFEDDFYHTGYVTELLPMDAGGDSYYYCKAGNETGGDFPEAKDSTVVFIVNLKG